MKKVRKHKHLLYKSIRRIGDMMGILLLLTAVFFALWR